VYVVYDVRGTPAQGGSLPNWLTSWTDTGLTMGTTDMARRVYSRDFVAGTVSLGGNMAAGARGAESNYTVMIVP
jgi:predicted alpha/beta-fold hydrolase